MNLKNKLIVSLLCLLVAGFGFFSAKVGAVNVTSNATTSAAKSVQSLKAIIQCLQGLLNGGVYTSGDISNCFKANNQATETVKCVFNNSNGMPQTCTSSNGRFSCTAYPPACSCGSSTDTTVQLGCVCAAPAKISCTVRVSDPQNSSIVWKSSCGNKTVNTKVDGIAEDVTFDCAIKTPICQRTLSGSPTESEKKECASANGVILCGNGWCSCNCAANCAKEGEKYSQVYNEYPKTCCSGLTEWASGMDTRKVVDGQCVETGLLAGSPIGTCIKCGDGVCGLNETVCNCAQDCQIVNCENQGTLFRADANKKCCAGLQKNRDSRPYGCDMGSAYNCNEGIYYTCTKCGDGVCENGETAVNCVQDCGGNITEKVTCSFANTNGLSQRCYSNDGKYSCTANTPYCCPNCSCISPKSIDCIIDISAKRGTKINWTSTCGGSAFTTVDGNSGTANFDCKNY